MQLPVQITFRDIPRSDAIEAAIRDKVAKLEQVYDRIMGCRVVVEAPHRHRHKGKLYHVRVDLTVPGGELVASRGPNAHHSHVDAYVAVRDAFEAARRQLEGFVRRQRRDVKTHEIPAHGRVSQLMPTEGYGRIQTIDGQEVYFHRNSVLDGFDKLEVGSEVRYAVEAGDQGPQASTVQLIGKHHLAG
jgi:cold shock CspA family protein